MDARTIPGSGVPIGHRIRERRREIHLTQGEAARQAGISVSYLSLIEHNKRAIGGSLLRRLATALDVDLGRLTDAGEARIAQELTGVFSDSIFERSGLPGDAARRLMGSDPDVGRAMLTLYRAFNASRQQADALSHRLSQDPVLLELSHRILSQITAVRSVSELLAETGDISEEQRERFHQALAGESAKLADEARALMGVLDSSVAPGHTATPVEEVDDLIIDHGNYFPELEQAAARLRGRLPERDDLPASALADLLAANHGIVVGHHGTPVDDATGYHYDPGARRLTFFERVPEPTARHQMGRLLARLDCAADLAAAVDDHRLTSDEARSRAHGALESYIAGAMLFPYERFLQSAVELRYDVDLLIQRFGGSFEQICHRLVTLRRPDAQGVPFAFMRSDPAGNISKRFSLPNLRLPRYREGCALWAVYQAFTTPDRTVAQRSVMPEGGEFLMVARSVTKQAPAFGSPRTRFAIMIACDAIYRDEVVYGDGFADDAKSLRTSVGVTCRLCSRAGCRQRAHQAISRDPS